MPHTKKCKKYQLGRSSIFFDLYDLSTFFCPTTRRNPRQLQLPRRPRRILDARGVTALHYAARNGRATVVEQLISAGATVDAATNDGRGLGRVFGSFCEWL